MVQVEPALLVVALSYLNAIANRSIHVTLKYTKLQTGVDWNREEIFNDFLQFVKNKLMSCIKCLGAPQLLQSGISEPHCDESTVHVDARIPCIPFSAWERWISGNKHHPEKVLHKIRAVHVDVLENSRRVHWISSKRQCQCCSFWCSKRLLRGKKGEHILRRNFLQLVHSWIPV